MRIRATHLLVVWLFGFLLSLVIQTWFADVTVWGRNVGWQAEIAIWNAGMSLVLFRLLREAESARAAAISGLELLSVAFGTNHLLEPRSVSPGTLATGWVRVSISRGWLLLPSTTREIVAPPVEAVAADPLNADPLCGERRGEHRWR